MLLRMRSLMLLKTSDHAFEKGVHAYEKGG